MWGNIINRSRDIARQGSQWLAAEPQLSAALCRWTGAAGAPQQALHVEVLLRTAGNLWLTWCCWCAAVVPCNNWQQQ